MGQLIVTPAIVLRRVAYGEADLIVTFLGLDTGRVSALARGARKSTKRFAGGLDPGLVGEATLRERPGAELFACSGFVVVMDRTGLSQDIAKAAHAAYAIELCDRLCSPRHPERAAYFWLDEFLCRLDRGRASAERLRVFELGLLRVLGLGPAFAGCAACGRADLGNEDVGFRSDAGGVLCRACSKAAERMSAATRLALVELSEASLAQAEEITLDRALAAACRRVTLALLHEHVHGPLRSLDFIEKMSGAMSGSR